MRSSIVAFAIVAGLMAAGAAQAEVVRFATALKGSDEVPANTTTGTGQVMAALDTNTKVFSYTITYSGLTGPATAAHFHGPAAPGVNAPPTIPIQGDLSSPVKGMATLTDAQIADLRAGKWYFNFHTAANKGGEIRGQLPAK